MKNGGLKIAIFLIVLIVAIAVSFNPLVNNLQLGLDLRGGCEVVLQAIPEEGEEITDEDMIGLIEVIRNRVDNLGVSEPTIQRSGEDRIIVELAGVDNPDDAIDLIGQTAKLEFIDPEGNVVISGSDLKNATGQNYNGSNYIALEFSDEGAQKFASATSANVGKVITIVLDDKVLMSPVVEEAITDGRAQISGNYTLEEAINFAAILKGGALPVDVEVLSKQTVGPTLGSDSLDKSLTAGIIGMILLCIFMIIRYRVPGVIAIFSLLVYALILFWLEHLLGVVFTLASIAGLLLSIGMAVDANIIIYERLREEVLAGKSLRQAIRAGFKRALWAILDSNITTILAAIVLYIFGSGPIQGFAITLVIGILVSMFSALFVTKYLLYWSAEIPGMKNKFSLYAPMKKADKKSGKGGAENA